MEKLREKLIHLHHCRGIGWKSIYCLLKVDPILSSIYNYSSRFYEKILPISKTQLKLFLNDLHSESFQSMLKQYNMNNIQTITILDDHYPYRLKQIYDPPWVLYYLGNPAILNENKIISVVGSRTPTSYGYHSMEKVLTPLIRKKWVVSSGLAKGIDTRAHQLAIHNRGKTIAVIAGGLYHIYPPENRELAGVIKEHHLLISEYPPYMKPEKWQFPMRNRIISGLAAGTIVIEAKDRSGSLITADQAIQQGREVFAIPGSIFEESSIGTNKLIQSGAKLVLSSEDILAEFEYVI
ncbi:DNA-processing protein DprA [Fredinandcohnia quinoae]|uniref:DNA-processing protein DprA n=1 Tax=Fredinandcohnia quinoae TaxID=2918902 RepID=A0AAW5E1A6_9BACI|nr:DNA-processing protein DprA [Fredinandcohnia sp. SECRCQ15]MCH1623796.1 DNA-processing protein DprA [Fredinandcohnia sp. SECRCQ15]